MYNLAADEDHGMCPEAQVQPVVEFLLTLRLRMHNLSTVMSHWVGQQFCTKCKPGWFISKKSELKLSCVGKGGAELGPKNDITHVTPMQIIFMIFILFLALDVIAYFFCYRFPPSIWLWYNWASFYPPPFVWKYYPEFLVPLMWCTGSNLCFSAHLLWRTLSSLTMSSPLGCRS